MFDFHFEAIPFTAPSPVRVELGNGVTALLLADSSLPLVSTHLQWGRGYVDLAPDLFGAGFALDEMLRTGGSTSHSGQEIDELLEFRATSLSVETSARSTGVGMNSLSRNLDLDLALLAELVQHPRLEGHALEVWQGHQLDYLRRRNDRPGPITSRAFSRLMYPGHPYGRVLEVHDVQGVDTHRLLAAYQGLLHPRHLTLGIAGDFNLDHTLRQLETHFGSWVSEAQPQPAASAPHLRTTGGVYIIHRPISQTSVITGHPGGVKIAETREYFATRVLNFILGGSGFTSRITREVRSIRGYAYSARTSWEAGVEGEGALMAITETRTDRAVAAVRLIADIFRGLREAPPTPEELHLAQENIRHSFLFELEVPAQLVHQQVNYLSRGLPINWFERYLSGISQVTAEDVLEVAQKFLRPDDMLTVMVGNRSEMDDLGKLGEVEELALEP